MKTIRRIGIVFFGLAITITACSFLGYKIFLDRPGFFRQFDTEMSVKEFLTSHLTFNETNIEYTIKFIHDHLSDGEGCTSLRDATIDTLYCLAVGCPLVTDESVNTYIHCRVYSPRVLVTYTIRFYFYHDKLIDISVGRRSNI